MNFTHLSYRRFKSLLLHFFQNRQVLSYCILLIVIVNCLVCFGKVPNGVFEEVTIWLKKITKKKKPDRLHYWNFRYATSCRHPFSEDIPFRETVNSRWVRFCCNDSRFLTLLLSFPKETTNLPRDLPPKMFWKSTEILTTFLPQSWEIVKSATVFIYWGVVQPPSWGPDGFEQCTFSNLKTTRKNLGRSYPWPCRKFLLDLPACSSLG